MTFKDQTILLISPEKWDHIFVSKHHYAIQLGKQGNKVFFLNPPGNEEFVAQTQYQNVFQVNYKGFPLGLRFYPALLRRRIIRAVYTRITEICQAIFQVVWSFDNSVFFDFSALPDSTLKICQIVDSNQDFQTQLAATTADYCFCVSEPIERKLRQYNAKVHKINHGFNVVHNAAATDRCLGTGKVKVVYAGNLSIPYIDWELLCSVVERRTDVDFTFIGPNGLDHDHGKKLAALQNVYFVGRVDSYKLPGYYLSADALLLAYQEQYHSDQTANSHKMMEYLGSGKVIIATKTLEYDGFYPLIVMSEKNSQWPELFDKVSADLVYYNSEELKIKRISFALEHTYQNQIKRIEQIINNS
jgi:glycosyltransferase involved in cell wall biosynthesis